MNLLGFWLQFCFCFLLITNDLYHQMVNAATNQNGFRFATNYGSNMVLQKAPLNAVLWGFGEENQIVRVQIGEGTPLLTTVYKGI